jgi:UDPglucose 6-dehydrogenase
LVWGFLLLWRAQVKREQIIQDLKEVLPHNPGAVDKLVTIVNEPYTAMCNAHAVALLTEWDEFIGACCGVELVVFFL